MRCIPAINCDKNYATYSYAEEVLFIDDLMNDSLETLIEPSFVFKLFASKSI